jgi:hypothetical protein
MERKSCRICLVEHDEQIHAATVSIHEWLHEQVMLSLYDFTEAPVPEPLPEYLAAS